MFVVAYPYTDRGCDHGRHTGNCHGSRTGDWKADQGPRTDPETVGDLDPHKVVVNVDCHVGRIPRNEL